MNYIKGNFKKLIITFIIIASASIAGGLVFGAGKVPLDISEEKVIEKYEKSQLKADYKLKGAKLVKEAKDENSIEIEVGGDTEFEPALRVSKWNDEVSFKIKAKMQGTDKKKHTLELENKKIKLDTPKKEYHFYSLPADEQNEDGGYEFEIILKEKPATNKVEFTIETDGLDFFYQPELTPEEEANGTLRPENVVGSYAVYYSTKKDDYSKIGGKNYKSGKAFHIYRPQIIDAVGKKAWGALNIDVGKKTLTVEIPQEFLDTAVYPVNHAAGLTFGYTTLGGSTTPNENTIKFESGQPASSGNGDKISVGVQLSVAGTVNYKCNIYTYVTATDAGAEITNGQTVEVAVTTTTKAWQDFTFSSAPSFTGGTNYHLASWADLWAGGTARIAFDYGAATEAAYKDIAYGAWPSPMTSESTSIYIHSIYTTYSLASSRNRLIIVQ
ncbi:MAG: hypothetical protein ABIG10_02685 [bacterium]